MKYRTNWEADPRAFFDAALKDFGLDSPSAKASTAGDRAVNTLAENIHDRGMDGQGPDGEWDRNAPSTIKKKGFDRPNIVTGEMLDVEQIMGDVSISKRQAVATYGKDEDVRKRATFAHEGQSSLKIKRPFLGITESDADEVLEGLADDIVNFLMRG